MMMLMKFIFNIMVQINWITCVARIIGGSSIRYNYGFSRWSSCACATNMIVIYIVEHWTGWENIIVFCKWNIFAFIRLKFKIVIQNMFNIYFVD